MPRYWKLPVLPAVLAVITTVSVPELGAIELKPGKPFPPLVLPDLEGKPRSIADFGGGKTILHIFASW